MILSFRIVNTRCLHEEFLLLDLAGPIIHIRGVCSTAFTILGIRSLVSLKLSRRRMQREDVVEARTVKERIAGARYAWHMILVLAQYKYLCAPREETVPRQVTSQSQA
jgi:hypothetical protein